MSVYSTNQEFQEDFKKSLIKSVALHGGLLILIFALNEVHQFYRGKTLAENIKIVESSVRVDMVAMPEKTFQELKAISQKSTQSSTRVKKENPKPTAKSESPPKKQESKVEYKKEVDSAEADKNKDSKNFMNMLQDVSKNGRDTDQKANSGIDQQNRKALEDLVLKGNKISQGAAIVGSASAEASDAFSSYLQQLPEHVRSHWELPSYLLNEGFRCRIRIYLTKSGRLLRAEIYESSESQEYDDMALRAVKNASPYPELKKEFADRGVKGHIVLGFPL